MKLALPKGQLQDSTAALLKEAGFAASDYREGSRSYRPRCEAAPGLLIKVFHEKDIAIQVAVGNYDLGICRLDWVEELLARYRSDAVVSVRDLGYGRRTLFAVAAAGGSGPGSLDALRSHEDGVRIVSEYPNLAETFALKQRLRRFQIFPVWGAAGVYLPEDAELAIMTETSKARLREQGLVAVAALMESSAWLVANRNSMGREDVSRLQGALSAARPKQGDVREPVPAGAVTGVQGLTAGTGAVSLALPDGHQQRHAVAFLKRAGFGVEGYDPARVDFRPRLAIDGVAAKVIRPQDMPQQVANGNFDLAITGRDWLRDHLIRFPSSPVEELLDLGFGRVRIVAVVVKDMPVSCTGDLMKLHRETPLRVASEYVNIADKYARDNRLTPYRLIPTWGATEAFLPEDADVLIENTETGSTIARHGLKIIETLFESTACLIGNPSAIAAPRKRKGASHLVEAMRRAV